MNTKGAYEGGIVGLSLKSRLDKDGRDESREVVEADDKNKGIRGIFSTVFAFKAHLVS